jgi:NAD(P)-dependent dehydrogenase (short-subunit alcohol dehydrogenase family)
MSGSATHEAHAGRVALVTGAAPGIGQAIAVGLAKQGATVVIGDIEDLIETSELIARTGKSAVAATLDISEPSVIDQVRVQVADELGRVDILVNNAAIFESATWDELDLELWQRVMGVNLNGPMLTCKAFLPLMRGQRTGPALGGCSPSVTARPAPPGVIRRHDVHQGVATGKEISVPVLFKRSVAASS